MKKLNDNCQFQKAIDLCKDQIKKENKENTSLAVNQNVFRYKTAKCLTKKSV